ncbi:hypothetical protein BPT24_101 [Tenacibaculum phage pT24]|uniref:Uncharacterized protein n=1 Tax=Tenacibaculum phage pT24 TaxID=1880590 RepID=A0A1B4XWP3_9CAUD|nr:hypothetical protein HYP10_gp101 [Tenacibaculum phage pT24]BAV39226.1 hypothetical protein BPT24_101 [Tenacibaculum phage pT24]
MTNKEVYELSINDKISLITKHTDVSVSYKNPRWLEVFYDRYENFNTVGVTVSFSVTSNKDSKGNFYKSVNYKIEDTNNDITIDYTQDCYDFSDNLRVDAMLNALTLYLHRLYE